METTPLRSGSLPIKMPGPQNSSQCETQAAERWVRKCASRGPILGLQAVTVSVPGHNG